MSRKNKGLVMDASKNGYITVMTNQGEFLEVPWTQKLPGIGNEVEFVNPTIWKGLLQKRYFSAMAASIVLLFILIPVWYGMYFPGSQAVVAYVNVDINPSVELGINEKENVIEVVGLNEDGEKLLRNLHLINLSIREALEIITNEAIEEQYLAPNKGNNILITVSSNEEFVNKDRSFENAVKKVLQKNSIDAEANIIEVSAEIHQKAKEENISTGKYVIYMEALEEGLELSLDDLREESIVNVVKEAGGVPGQLISKIKQDKNRIKEIDQKHEERKKEWQKQKQMQIDDSANNAQQDDVNEDNELDNNGLKNDRKGNGLEERQQGSSEKKEEFKKQQGQEKQDIRKDSSIELEVNEEQQSQDSSDDEKAEGKEQEDNDKQNDEQQNDDNDDMDSENNRIDNSGKSTNENSNNKGKDKGKP